MHDGGAVEIFKSHQDDNLTILIIMSVITLHTRNR